MRCCRGSEIPKDYNHQAGMASIKAPLECSMGGALSVCVCVCVLVCVGVCKCVLYLASDLDVCLCVYQHATSVCLVLQQNEFFKQKTRRLAIWVNRFLK